MAVEAEVCSGVLWVERKAKYEEDLNCLRKVLPTAREPKSIKVQGRFQIKKSHFKV